MTTPVRIIAVLLYLVPRDRKPCPIFSAERVPLLVLELNFCRIAVGIIAAGHGRFVRHEPG